MVGVHTLPTFILLLSLGACGSDAHPDTGYGGNKPVPSQITCMAACTRIADCAVALCNEDTDSTRYSGLEELLIDDCLVSCNDADLAAQIAPPAWSCMFTETCRGVFEHDVCDVDGRYTCRQ
jgi:hypothetical protein